MTHTTNTEMTAITAAHRARVASAQKRGDAEELRVLDIVYECAAAARAAQQRRDGRATRFFTAPTASDTAIFDDVLEHECAARGYPLR